MNFESTPHPIDILLVEDNAADVRLTEEVLTDSKVHNNLIVANDGQEALMCLRRQGNNLHANCYITKPVDLEQFVTVVRYIEDFWLAIVRLPGNGKR